MPVYASFHLPGILISWLTPVPLGVNRVSPPCLFHHKQTAQAGIPVRLCAYLYQHLARHTVIVPACLPQHNFELLEGSDSKISLSP